MRHVMVDIETLGTTPGSVISAIGAVEFDPATLTLGKQFYMPIDVADAQRNGFTIDAGTVLWWLEQSAEARAEMTSSLRAGVYSAMAMFLEYLQQDDADIENVLLWGNGASFDNVLLAAACDRLGLQKPKFWNDRCFRTLKSLFPIETRPKPEVPHHAMYDAIAQAQHALEIAKKYPQIVWG